MTRDSRKPVAFFDQWISYDLERLGKMDQVVSSFPDQLEQRHLGYLHNYVNKHLQVMLCRYSRGDAIGDLGELCTRAGVAFGRFLDGAVSVPDSADAFPMDLDRVQQSLWLIGLTWASCGESTVREHLLQLITRRPVNPVLARVVRHIDPNAEVEVIGEVHRPHHRLVDLLEGASWSEASFIEYLDGWYGLCNEAYWHETHKGDDLGYFGYWCVELSLAAKIRDLPVSASVQGHPFYPADL